MFTFFQVIEKSIYLVQKTAPGINCLTFIQNDYLDVTNGL